LSHGFLSFTWGNSWQYQIIPDKTFTTPNNVKQIETLPNKLAVIWHCQYSFFANTILVSSYYGTDSFVFGWYHHIITVPILAIFRKTSMLGYPNFKTVFLIYDKVNERVYT